MKKQNSHHQPRRRKLVNTLQPRKETRPEIFSGHVAAASYAHEQVKSIKTTEQRTEEAAGRSTGHQ
jgi:hypothetical protein